MSNNRKLQSEIDRLLKKVQEGCQEFDVLLEKVYTATSANQKEKCEQDLKREIKKLQRSRDQIKAWIASNDVKQKAQLLDARKNIETKMEQFKTCEKDSKTKAFSRVGLQTASTSESDEKAEARAWIGKTLKELKNQIDQFESEIEQVPVKKRPGNAQITKLQSQVEKHKFHLNKLEKVLRNLENDTISPEQVMDIKESVEYYIESNEFFDADDLYDSLNLKEDDGPIGTNFLKESGEFSQDGSGSYSDEEGDNLSQGSAGSANSSTSITSSTSSQSTSSSVTSSAAAVPAPPAKVAKKENQPTPAPPAAIRKENPISGLIANPTPATPAPTPITPVPYQALLQQQKSAKQTPTPTTTTTPPLPSAVPPVGQHARKGSGAGITSQSIPSTTAATSTQSSTTQPRIMRPPPSVLQPPSDQQSTQPQTQTQPAAPTPTHPLAPGATTAATLNAVLTSNQPTASPTPPPTSTPSAATAPSPAPTTSLAPGGSIAPTTSTAPEPFNRANPHIQYNQFARNTGASAPPGMAGATPPVRVHTPQEHYDKQRQVQLVAGQPPQAFPPLGTTSQELSGREKLTSTGSVSSAGVITSGASDSFDSSVDNKNDTFDTSSPVSAGEAASLSDLSSSTHPMNHSDQFNVLAMLETSMRNAPEPVDSERPKQYIPRNPFTVPTHYPQIQSALFENPALFEKFDTDTLFFIFYYQQGTYQQYLSAKELKKQSWRYHKKYQTWFQRHEEPKEITNDYEQGTYVYFDYETGWCQRKKTEFTFEYRYLEDYD